MLVLGLTGGIGSGKTTVAQIFKSFGVPVYNSDERAKHILVNDKTVHQPLKEVFGEAVFINNIPDKQKLAKVVFSHKEKLKQLNAIIHPKVGEDFEAWKNAQNAEVVLKEAAILIESGAYKSVGKIIVISAPKAVRIKRVIDRDKVSEKEVLQRMSNQLTDEERLKYADFVIDNSGTRSLIPQVKDILTQINFVD